jgi:hypothetical protein
MAIADKNLKRGTPRFRTHLFTTEFGRVEKWRGGLGLAYRFPALSFAGASLAVPCFRFHFPLIEPDVRISRIRLSDQVLPQGLRDPSACAGLTTPMRS